MKLLELPLGDGPVEWWQLWSCHLAHWNLEHLLLNVMAIAVPVLLVPRSQRALLAAWAVCAAPAISLLLLASPLQGHYRGASALAVGAWLVLSALLVREGRFRAGGIIALAVALKLASEVAGLGPAHGAFTTSPLVHIIGAAAGLGPVLLASAIGLTSAAFTPSRAEQWRH